MGDNVQSEKLTGHQVEMEGMWTGSSQERPGMKKHLGALVQFWRRWLYLCDHCDRSREKESGAHSSKELGEAAKAWQEAEEQLPGKNMEPENDQEQEEETRQSRQKRQEATKLSTR